MNIIEFIRMEHDAIAFAKEKHKGQLDSDGKDYFESHLRHVADILKVLKADKETIIAGYAHDTLEDTATTKRELEERFGERVANLVWQVTHEGQKDEYGYYFPNLDIKDRQAIILKYADTSSNLSRMEGYPQDRVLHHLKLSKHWRAFKGDRWIKKEELLK